MEIPPCKAKHSRGMELQKKKRKMIKVCRKSVLESSCARKVTVDIDILATSRNGDRKIMQSIIIISRPSSGIKKHLATF